MDDLITVTTRGDRHGEYVVFPEGFELPFGTDDNIVLEKIGDVLYITRAEDEASRQEYGGTPSVSSGSPKTPA